MRNVFYYKSITKRLEQDGENFLQSFHEPIFFPFLPNFFRDVDQFESSLVKINLSLQHISDSVETGTVFIKIVPIFAIRKKSKSCISRFTAIL